MDTKVRDVIVVGGGISGLTSAWHLKKAGIDVCLVEATSEVGGCAQTRRHKGFLLEKGPFNVIVRDPAFEAVLDDIATDIHIVPADPSAKKRYIYRYGKIHQVPTGPMALATTGLIGLGAKFRLLRGLIWSRRSGTHEETIAQAATRRFGVEVSDTLVSAAISGILAGDVTQLSLAACFPSAGRVDAVARSLVAYGLRAAIAARRNASRRKRKWRGLISFDNGLGGLTGAMGKRLGDDLHTQCQVKSVSHADQVYELSCRMADGSAGSYRARSLVWATSASVASTLLKPLLPRSAKLITTIASTSLIVLHLGFRRPQIGHPLDGFGFLVPRNEREFPLLGVLFADSVFPHHAPPDHRLIRVFIGGARDPNAIEKTDGELRDLAMRALRGLLQISGEPTMVDVCRHPSAIPQYHLGHLEKIERVRDQVRSMPGLFLTGNYLDGASLNDCVRLGAKCAQEVAAYFDRSLHEPSEGKPNMETRHNVAV